MTWGFSQTFYREKENGYAAFCALSVTWFVQTIILIVKVDFEIWFSNIKGYYASIKWNLQ